MKESVLLILGNGFDLDLGLKTSYKDFVESKLLHKREECVLFERICKRYESKLWIDVEEDLKTMATDSAPLRDDDGRRIELYPDLIGQYNTLVQELSDFIKEIDYELINKESAASKVIRHVAAWAQEYRIIDFNYTNIDTIAQKIGWSKGIPCDHIHGEVAANSMIVGFNDNVDVAQDEYCRMIKSHSEHYRSVNINEALENATEIIFFGHSLGSTDYSYFSNFFRSQVNEPHVKKRIRIFTYDEAARQNILLQLRNMNDKKTLLLFDRNDLQFYRTAPKYTKDHQAIDEYCHSFKTRVENHRRSMDALAASIY